MSRWLVIPSVIVLSLSLFACAGPGADEIGGGDPGSGAFALTNTTHYNPDGLLRGQGLKVYTEVRSDQLEAGIWDIRVTNDNTNRVLLGDDDRGRVQLRVQDGTIEDYSLMFDVGQYGEVEEGDNIRVELENEDGVLLTQLISLSALRLPGWDVEEVTAPEVFVCDAAGAPANAYAVSDPAWGAPPANEVSGNIRITGTGFPATVHGAEVDVYIVDAEATEDWMDGEIPQAGQAGHVAGPIAVTIDGSGNLPVTDLGVGFTTDDVGVFDVLVDTDRNGRMDWSISVKDGGDGVDEQVGFTIQLSAAYARWLEEQRVARGQRHFFVNLAYDSSERSGGDWRNTFRAGESVYTYLNPPVMHQFHFAVTKWVVRHQDFEAFWNNQDLETTDSEGHVCVPFEVFAHQQLGVPVQRGCTNSGPVAWGPAAMVDGTDAFDVVFDRNGDGCYAPGVDLLDVIGGGMLAEGLVSFEEFESLDEADRVGFRVSE